jgi:hypothetical protein
MSEWNGIFRFEGEDKRERVWIVSKLTVSCTNPRQMYLDSTSTFCSSMLGALTLVLGATRKYPTSSRPALWSDDMVS